MAELSAEDPDQALQSVMHTLTASAITTNLGRCATVDRALTALERGDVPADVRAEAVRAAHQIVGSAGTFGFPQVSLLASRLEAYLRALTGTTGPQATADLVRARGWLTQIQEELQPGSAGDHAPER